MKIKENVTLYICEHCNKKYQVKKACEKHEIYCFKAPDNYHKCFQHCKHLIKEVEIYDIGNHYDGSEFYQKRCGFKCAVTGQYMYSFIAERTDNIPVYNEYIEESREYIRMPLECDLYLDKIDADIQDFYTNKTDN